MKGLILLEEEDNEKLNPSITLCWVCNEKTSQCPSLLVVAPESGDIDKLAAINTNLFKSERSGAD